MPYPRVRTRRNQNNRSHTTGSSLIPAQISATALVLATLFVLFTFFPAQASKIQTRFYPYYQTGAITTTKQLLRRVKQKLINRYNGMGGTDQAISADTTPLATPANADLSPIKLSHRPCAPVTGARVSSPFGYRIHPITKQTGFHYGVDLAAPMDTPIFATLSGKVTRAATSDSYGNYIELDHGNGLMSLYGHCNAHNVRVGTVVRQGEVIAFVGNTGVSTGPHLHFELRLGNKNINPLWYVGEQYGYPVV